MAAALKQLFSKQLFPLISKGLSGAVYTQLSDVERSQRSGDFTIVVLSNCLWGIRLRRHPLCSTLLTWK